jgi:SNF2 family DNA or RNA helicase
LEGRLNDEGPFLILCPLSVLRNWIEEMERYRVDVAEILLLILIKIVFWMMCKI